MTCASENYLRKTRALEGTEMFTSEISIVREEDLANSAKPASQNAARAPQRSPLASNTLSNARKSKRGAKRCAHRQKQQSPPATQSSSNKPDESRQAHYRACAPRPARRGWRRSITTATPAVFDRGADGRTDRAGIYPLRRRLPVSYDPEPLVLRRRHVPLGLPARRRHQVLDQREQHLYSGPRAAASFERRLLSTTAASMASSPLPHAVNAVDASSRESTAAASRRSRPAQASSN